MALRSATPGRMALAGHGDTGFHAGVVARACAEKTASLGARVRAMFEDMHLVYAGLGAAAATVVCAVVMLGMMRLVANGHPDSLMATMSLLALPGSDLNPVVVDAGMLMPRALDDVLFVAPGTKGRDDTAFMFSGVVTREGHIVNLELHRESGQAPPAGSREAQELEHLLGAVSMTRFEPARVAGFPVAVNMVWLVTQTTVHATKSGLDLPSPPTVKKRQASASPVSARPPSTIA
jgi:hypothetical protein